MKLSGSEAQTMQAYSQGLRRFQRLEPAGETVGCDEISKVRAKLLVAVVLVALDRRVLDRVVLPLDLAASRETVPRSFA